MQKISYHCTLYFRLGCDMLCSFFCNADYRHALWIYNQGTAGLWFLWECYLRQLLYKSACVLLENQGDKTSGEEHSKGVENGMKNESPPPTGKQNDILDANVRKQRWRSGESTRLPPMWSRLKSRRRRHLWVEFVVGSLPCTERFFFGLSGFPLSSNPTLSNSSRSRTYVHIEMISH